MIVDVPSDIQMAIRLRAVKSQTTTGAVICEAVEQIFGRELQEAKAVLAEKHNDSKSTARR
jgi:hypothetical protein